MDKAQFIRHAIKNSLGIAGTIACGFILLTTFRPDITNSLTGTNSAQNATNSGQSYFARLFTSSGKASHWQADSSYKGATGPLARSVSGGKSRASEAREGKLRKKFGGMAFGTLSSKDLHMPFQYRAVAAAQRTTRTQTSALATAMKSAAKPGHGSNRAPVERVQASSPQTNSEDKDRALQRAAQPVNHGAAKRKINIDRIAADLPRKLTPLLREGSSLNDDALVADSLLSRAEQNIRLAPFAIAAVEDFIGLHAGSPEANELKKKLADFHRRNGDELLARSSVKQNETLLAANLSEENIAGIRSCIADTGQVTGLSVARKPSVSGIPAYVAAANVRLIAGASVMTQISDCLAPLFETGTVAIFIKRFGANSEAVKRITATKDARIYWTGFATVSSGSGAH